MESPDSAATISTAKPTSGLKSTLLRLTRMTIDQLDALAALPECGDRAAVIRQAVAEFFETKFPGGVPHGITPIRKAVLRRRRQ